MKLPTLTAGACALSICGALALSADAALLSIDFNQSSSPTEAGFIGQNNGNTTHSTAEGDIQVEVIGAQGNFNDGTAVTNNMDFYRDFYFRNGGNFTLRLSGPGINAGADYDLTFWSFRINDTRATTYVPTNGTVGPTLGPIGNDNTQPTGLSDARYTDSATYTANGSGVLEFSLQGNRPAINGFEVDAVIPEPSSLALLGLGGLLIARRRRG